MNRPASAASWLAFACLGLTAPAGCTSILNAGRQDDGGQHTSGTAGTSESSGGVVATSSSSGAVTGSSGGRATTGGTAGDTSGSTSGGSTGGTGGGDGGACFPNGTACAGNDACCSGSCSNICRQGLGDPCLGDNDCSSINCMNERCVCSGHRESCATDQDCCSDGGCSLTIYQGVQWGYCCRSVGESCGGTDDCCDQNCVDGQCQCVPGGGACSGSLGGCCSGICENGACKDAIGAQCTASNDCASANCDGGVCGCGISYSSLGEDEELEAVAGLCSSNSDCCPDFKCATNLYLMDGVSQAFDGGNACCAAAGASCDQGGDGQGTTCCGDCQRGTCICEPPGPGSDCSSNETCCAGGVCLPNFANTLSCCQPNQQPCFTPDECCSGFCTPGNTCACVPEGGQCGSIGTIAPLGPAACCSGACSDAGSCL